MFDKNQYGYIMQSVEFSLCFKAWIYAYWNVFQHHNVKEYTKQIRGEYTDKHLSQAEDVLVVD